ncbi:MAG: alkene reductase [Rhodocyclaceae bacterium]|uniref:Alkene reductase n=1 Tax=Candidatus Desulfobacillus denitrificans TaxID=2608985 RepID=A0A809S2R5_9PROT|nr:alkene reductase [Candidatus Desulfobacillus denitrificans]GIK46772.1 MAG: alkene reductase [Betaproteobacteria bacterium]GJQ56346.1 MAG: alkene reductase [Rhodocyclaceae bacterium]
MSAGKLFSPFKLGALALPNRIAMAPMTRCRAANPAIAPTPMMVEYYGLRADAGLIVSEGVPVSPQARGYAFTPGLYSTAQVAGWQAVTQEVHQQGGRIFAQLWHCGRISHGSLREDNAPPVGPSILAANGRSMALDRATGQPAFVTCETPRALSTAEVKGVVGEFVQAARNAIAAGFDGVEIHGANGYLLDQFRCPYVNDRHDEYGGSLENRCRLHLDIAREVAAAVGRERTGIRLSPHGQANDMRPDPEPMATYGYLAEELQKLGLAYLHLYDQSTSWIHDADDALLRLIRAKFTNALMLCGGFDGAKAEAALAAGSGDLIAIGKPFISNPDLVARLRQGVETAPWDSKTFYVGGHGGYLDYPSFSA